MKELTCEILRDLDFNFTGLSNKPLKDKCIKCHAFFEYKKLKKFLRNRRTLPFSEWCRCQKCFLKHRTGDNPEWISKNRESQLISQNKPETKKKNALAVSKSWTLEKRKKASEDLKERWKNDIEFANKAKNNLKYDTNQIKKSFGLGGLKGIYKKIYYDSALELSYLLWCEDNNISVKRYDKDPISYIFQNKSRLYFPDFIVDDKLVIEIKGKGLYFAKNKERNLEKTKEAIRILGDQFLIIFDQNKEVKTNYKKARRLHHAIKEKNSN